MATASLIALVAVEATPAAAEPVTTVKGEACSYMVKVGLFGGAQSTTGCNEGINANNTGTPRPPQGGTDPYPADTSYSPHVALPGDGSGGTMSASDSNGAKGVWGPATIHGGLWPCEAPGTDPNGDGYPGNCLTSAPPSGPQNASTEGSTSLGTVTSTAEINLHPTPIPIGCYAGYPGGYGPNCVDRGGFGPFPVSGDSMNVECSANGSSVSGSTTFSNATLATSTDGDGTPVDEESVPDSPPVNYTRHGVITNVGDVFTVVYNEQTVNADGSLTVIGTHMYLFGPVAIGEVIRGQVTCGTDQSAIVADTLAPSCGTPVVKPMGPEDPTPQSPRSELVGTFDARGIQSVSNVAVTNGAVTVGQPGSSQPYLQFVSGQTGPLAVTATRTAEAESARLPMHWSFDVTDVAGNTSQCVGFEGPPAANDEAFTAYKNTTLTVVAPGVLGNDTEANDDPMTAGSASDPANGSVTLNPDGSFVYTPDAGFVGTDTFTYIADDGRGLTDSATVTITVEALVAPTELRVTQGAPPQGPYGNLATEGGDGETSAHTFTVTRSGSTAAVSTVKVRTSGGTATAGTDYTALPLQTLTFAVGETSKTVTVDVLGDGVSEKDETFNLVLSAPTNAFITDNLGLGTILNDDSGLPRFSVDVPFGALPPSVDEGDAGSSVATFTIYRDYGNTTGSSTVKYKTSGGTATAGTDYTAVPLTTITFGPDEYSKTVDIDVTGDLTPENNETFNLVLSSPVGATIGDASGTATIVDNEGPVTPAPATFIAVDDFGGGGGQESQGSSFFVARYGDTSGTSTVNYTVSGGTATAGIDYAANDWGPALSGTLTFGPDEGFAFLDFATIDDNLVEKNETFNVVLSAPTGAVITDSRGLHTIVNDDGLGSLSIDDPYLAEGNSGTTPATFTITRSGDTNCETTVKYATKVAPSAEADDFTAIPLQTLTFAPGETSRTVSVDVVGDSLVEPNERFSLALSAPVGASLQDSAGTALVINDD